MQKQFKPDLQSLYSTALPSRDGVPRGRESESMARFISASAPLPLAAGDSKEALPRKPLWNSALASYFLQFGKLHQKKADCKSVCLKPIHFIIQ
jgi:hypothetical protein